MEKEKWDEAIEMIRQTSFCLGSLYKEDHGTCVVADEGSLIKELIDTLRGRGDFFKIGPLDKAVKLYHLTWEEFKTKIYKGKDAPDPNSMCYYMDWPIYALHLLKQEKPIIGSDCP